MDSRLRGNDGLRAGMTEYGQCWSDHFCVGMASHVNRPLVVQEEPPTGQVYPPLAVFQ